MKTLAELKRAIKVGTKILTVRKIVKTNSVGTIRTVDRVQTNAFTMDGSWLWWTKAKDYEIDGDTFAIYCQNKPHTDDYLIGVYQIIGG